MEINDFIAISIVGVGLSMFVELIKEKFQNGFASRTIIFASAILLGSIYIWIRSTPYFETVLTVLMAASTFYAFFLAKKPNVV